MLKTVNKQFHDVRLDLERTELLMAKKKLCAV